MTDTTPRPLDELAASVAARRRGALAALSPWARQMLAAGERSEPRGIGVLGAARGRLSLTAPERFPISQRVVTTRFVERPLNLGALSPELPDRFAERVTQRFPSVAAKYELKEMGEGEPTALELPMAEGGLPGDLEAAPEFPMEAPSPERGLPASPRPRPSAPQSFGSLKEQIAAMRAEAEARAQAGMPSRTAQISSAVRRPPPSQPAPTRAPERPRPGEALTPKRPTPGHAQRVRRFAQIEELTQPAAPTRSPGAAPAAESPRRVEEPITPEPPAPIPVMRQQEGEARPPVEREAAPPSAGPEVSPPSIDEERLPLRTPPVKPPVMDEARPSMDRAPTSPPLVQRAPTEPAGPEAPRRAPPVVSPQARQTLPESPSAEMASLEPDVAAQSKTPLPLRDIERPPAAPTSPEAIEPPLIERAPEPLPARDESPREPSTPAAEAAPPTERVMRTVAEPTEARRPKESPGPEAHAPATAPVERLPLRQPVVTERAPAEPAPRPDEVAPIPYPESREPEARPERIAKTETQRAEPSPGAMAEGESTEPTVVSQIARPLPLPRPQPQSAPETQPAEPNPLAALNETLLARVVSSARLPTLRAPSLSTRRAPQPKPAEHPATVSSERTMTPASEAPVLAAPEVEAPAGVEPIAIESPSRLAPAAPALQRAPESESLDEFSPAALLRSHPVERTAVLPQARQPEEAEAREAGSRWTPPAQDESFAPALPLREPVARAVTPERQTESASAEDRAPPAAAGPKGEPAGAPLTLAEPARKTKPTITSTRSGIVQRAEGEASAPAPGEAPSKRKRARDLDELARQVLPVLKRMLAVERERRSGY